MTTKQHQRSKGWNIALWALQIVLATFFLGVGIMKATTPLEDLATIVPLAGEMPVLVRFIGISEVAGALGLILPAGLRIRPQLTVIAAGALTVVMILAMVYHVSKGEYAAIGTNIVLGILAALITFGRLNKAPITARTSSAI